jgi:hypothetical protein
MIIQSKIRTFDSVLGWVNPGDKITVTDKMGSRWIKRNFAVEVIDHGGQTEQGNAEGYEAQAEQGHIGGVQSQKAETSRIVTPSDYSEMTRAELVMQATKRGIALKASMNKAEIIEALLGG